MMYIQDKSGNKTELLLNPVGDTFPIGMYAYFAGENAPTNWLRCDGQEVSRTEYKELFNAIGTTYGTGDGSTTFNLPNINLENRTLVGSSGDGEFSVGNTGGEKEHALTISEMPAHSHGISCGWTSGETPKLFYNSNNASNSMGTESMGGNQPHNNMPPFMASICCIKARQSVGIVADKAKDINDTNENAWVNAKTIKDYASRKVATATISNEIQNFKRGTIALNTIKSNTSLLTLENNGIKIGKGIKRILVSGNVFGNAQGINTSYLWIYIKKNDEVVSNALSNPSSWFTSTVLSPNLIDVQEGDVITLWKEDDVATHIRSKAYTYLTVEVIE